MEHNTRNDDHTQHRTDVPNTITKAHETKHKKKNKTNKKHEIIKTIKHKRMQHNM